MASDSLEALNRGLLLHQAGKLTEAKALYVEILGRTPEHAGAHHLLGVAEGQTGNVDGGVRHILRAIELEPGVAKFHSNLGALLRKKNDLAGATRSFRRAVELDPGFLAAWTNLGAVLLAQHDAAGAAESFGRAAALAPRSAEILHHLGTALHAARRREDAAAAYRAALALENSRSETYDALGRVLQELGQTEAALEAFKAALTLKPDFAEAENNLAHAMRRAGRGDEALAHYRRATALQPHKPTLHSNLLLALHYQSRINPASLAQEHADWNRRHAEPLRIASRPHDNLRDPAKKLRVGFVSADLRDHVVARFLCPVLEHADPAALEIIAYSGTTREDEMSRRLQSRTILWRRTAGLADEALAELIRGDRIDILVDLSGHTGGNRLTVFARKPAPVQMTWLGYPNTSGLTAMDFRVTDSLADPVGLTESFHSERLLRLPACAWCYPETEAPECRMPPAEGRLVFGSFNNLAKINSELVRTWSRILQAEPRATLVLKDLAFGDASVQRDYERRFAAHGVEAARLRLLSRDSNYQAHLAHYQRLHVALDPFPYNGTTTTCEALWMGVPVVTLAGESHVSRVGASLLTNAGLPYLVAVSEDNYVELALATARDEPALARLRPTLRTQMLRSPVMDAPRFARDLANLFRAAWVEWCSR